MTANSVIRWWTEQVLSTILSRVTQAKITTECSGAQLSGRLVSYPVSCTRLSLTGTKIRMWPTMRPGSNGKVIRQKAVQWLAASERAASSRDLSIACKER